MMCIPHGRLREMALTLHEARILASTGVTGPCSIVVSDEGCEAFVGLKTLRCACGVRG